ncbi:MAG: hypothetical protein HC927_07800 [Deltaproteobacteria bacterium]|nr:hypothetical protein [Deltaproteobacteria bacterium]
MSAATVELQQAPRSHSLHAVDPASLTRSTMRELDQLFAELDPATLGELQGRKRGRVLAVSGFDWIPGVARSAVLAFVNELPIWRGKNFEGEFGANDWLVGGARLQFARYLIREAPALDGQGSVVQLDYDVAANPGVLRRIVGEVRHLGPGLFLGRMQYLWGEKVVKVMYFSLES